MKIIYGERQTGNTTRLVEWIVERSLESEEEKRYYIDASTREKAMAVLAAVREAFLRRVGGAVIYYVNNASSFKVRFMVSGRVREYSILSPYTNDEEAYYVYDGWERPERARSIYNCITTGRMPHAVAEEMGVGRYEVEVCSMEEEERAALKALRGYWEHLYVGERPMRPWPSNFAREVEVWKDGWRQAREGGKQK